MPMLGQQMMTGDRSLIAHGFASAVYDKQTGPRGDNKGFTESIFMPMGIRPLGPGTLGVRPTVSLDPTQASVAIRRSSKPARPRLERCLSLIASTRTIWAHRHQEFLALLRSIDKAVPPELDVHCSADNASVG